MVYPKIKSIKHLLNVCCGRYEDFQFSNTYTRPLKCKRILIISDISNTPLLVKNVANLRNYFQELRNSIDYQIEVKVYWSSVTDLHDLNGTEERHKIVSGLTDHPVLIG
ncbi:hypothetical protein ND2E_4109 [Colwellia psychrerythraea]|uniref:Uncharacterized protein n=1 Tax=Colwellia psychrerythraea TaxID=28229 RepID=A0A099KF76_COLPS|nr:hypothetical protein ND2E_4109 [Colwellia psychrerythraea]